MNAHSGNKKAAGVHKVIRGCPDKSRRDLSIRTHLSEQEDPANKRCRRSESDEKFVSVLAVSLPDLSKQGLEDELEEIRCLAESLCDSVPRAPIDNWRGSWGLQPISVHRGQDDKGYLLFFPNSVAALSCCARLMQHLCRQSHSAGPRLSVKLGVASGIVFEVPVPFCGPQFTGPAVVEAMRVRDSVANGLNKIFVSSTVCADLREKDLSRFFKACFQPYRGPIADRSGHELYVLEAEAFLSALTCGEHPEE